MSADLNHTNFPLPAWVQKAPKAERSRMAAKFRLLVAALYANEKGSLRQLSLALDLNPSTLATYVSGRESVPPATCIKLERHLGADLFPREFFNPEHFRTGR